MMTYQIVDELRNDVERLEKKNKQLETCIVDLSRQIRRIEINQNSNTLNLRKVFNDSFPLERI